MGLLEYENEIFVEGFNSDGLFITARGLGVDRIFLNFLNVYCDPASLVLVLNTNETDQEYLREQLENQGVQPLPKIITNEVNASDRLHSYLEGGVQFITSRILVVDLLQNRVPAEKVTGILVYKAHQVIESGQEAFILRLYREKNKFDYLPQTAGAYARSRSDPFAVGLMWFGLPLVYIASYAGWVFFWAYCTLSSVRHFSCAGLVFTPIRSKVSDEHLETGFIKAFSDNPESFTAGFCHVERVMKNLFVKKLFLWPRFHANVVSCLNKFKVDVVELHLQLTPLMTDCQTALLDLINVCIKELKRCTPAVDMEEISAETAMGRDFDQMVRVQLDPIWHMLSSKTRQLVADLKTLRQVLRHLTQYDCVTFYNVVNSIRTSEKAFGQNTGWLFLDAADSLFVSAKRRVLGDTESPVKAKEEGGKAKKKENTPLLEETPKWQALKQVLDEINGEIQQMVSSGSLSSTDECRVLVCAEDDSTCNQLKEFLCGSSTALLKRMYNKYFGSKAKRAENMGEKDWPVKKRKLDGQGKTKIVGDSNKGLTLTQMARRTGAMKIEASEKEGEVISDLDEEVRDDELVVGLSEDDVDAESETEERETAEMGPGGTGLPSRDSYYGRLSGPVTILHPLHGCTDPHGLTRTLLELQPTYVVLYDPDMQFVRQLEVYQAVNPSRQLRVYFLLYSGSVEEQRYLTILRREKEAFEYLIKEKATMVIPEERDGRTDTEVAKNGEASGSSRKGGLPQLPVEQRIIVDMREFRSELPSLIHRRGINVEPVTLEIGDYILTPDICVERKSISDLIGSLNSGRLYNQCVAMCRCYKRPVLLIEFDPSKSFSLQSKYPMANDVSLNETTSRLALLTMHFPQLRILWCPSPYATAEIFEELKVNRAQPVGADAMTMRVGDEAVEWGEIYSHTPQDMVLRMPGVTSKNYRCILNKYENLLALSQASQEELAQVLGNSAQAKQLHEFFNTQADQKPTAADKSAGKGKAGKRPFKRKR